MHLRKHLCIWHPLWVYSVPICFGPTFIWYTEMEIVLYFSNLKKLLFGPEGNILPDFPSYPLDYHLIFFEESGPEVMALFSLLWPGRCRGDRWDPVLTLPLVPSPSCCNPGGLSSQQLSFKRHVPVTKTTPKTVLKRRKGMGWCSLRAVGWSFAALAAVSPLLFGVGHCRCVVEGLTCRLQHVAA